MSVLVTGDAGYIGSHSLVELLNSNHEVVVIDNLCKSPKIALGRVSEITGNSVIFYLGGILNASLLDTIFTKHNIEVVIHFDGFCPVNPV